MTLQMELYPVRDTENERDNRPVTLTASEQVITVQLLDPYREVQLDRRKLAEFLRASGAVFGGQE